MFKNEDRLKGAMTKWSVLKQTLIKAQNTQNNETAMRPRCNSQSYTGEI